MNEKGIISETAKDLVKCMIGKGPEIITLQITMTEPVQEGISTIHHGSKTNKDHAKMEVAITWTEKIVTTPDQVDTNGTHITRGATITIDHTTTSLPTINNDMAMGAKTTINSVG